jgi:preprotein translocase subunit SecG
MFLYGLVITVHVIASLILICVILLQAGRGGGLSESFGGESRQTIFGTKTSVFLARATMVAAGFFLITSILLGILTSRRGKSLIDIERSPVTTIPAPVAENFIPKKAVTEEATPEEAKAAPEKGNGQETQ